MQIQVMLSCHAGGIKRTNGREGLKQESRQVRESYAQYAPYACTKILKTFLKRLTPGTTKWLSV